LETKGKGAFVREATGLVREASALDVFQFNGLSVTGVQMVPPWILLVPFIGAPLGPLLLIAVTGAILIGAMYYILSVSMPRSGGDYVLGSRMLHPLAGIFTGTMTGILAGIVLVSWGATAWVPTGLSPLLAFLGALWNDKGLMDMASTVTQPTFYGSLAVVALIVFTLLLGLGGMRKYFVVQNVLVGISIIAQLLIVGVLASTDHNTFVREFNSFLQPFDMGYDQILSGAQSSGWSAPAAVSLSLAFLAAPNLYGSMFWVQASSYLGGEIKHIRRSQLIGMVGCLLFWMALAISTFLLMINMVGYDFISAHDYLILKNPEALGSLPPVPQYLIYVMVAARNPAIATFIALGLIAGTIPVVPWALILFSRSIFAMSFDRILPSFLSDISERFHTALKTLVLCSVVSFGFIALAFLPQAAAFVTYFGVAQGFLYVITFVVIGFGAMLFPYLKKGLYETACPFKGRLLGIPIISILGALVLIFNIQDGYFLMSFPQYYGVTPEFLGTLVAAGIFALVAYVVAKAYRKRQGIDISLIFKELPPE